MSKRLQDKVAIITGAAKGIGFATAQRFAQEGAKVIIADINLDAVKAATAQIAGADAYAMNVTDRASIQTVVDQIMQQHGRIDILVNNAGLALGLEPAHKADLSDWDRMIDTNIKGLVHMTRALLPGMVERKLGHVINLGSVAANYPYPGGNTYGATKAFVQQFSLNLRADLIGTPIRVTCIEPGMCSGTEFSNVRFKGDDAKAGNVYEGVHALSADEIAETIYWSATLPSHMNINVLEVMPVQQSFSAFQIHRGKL